MCCQSGYTLLLKQTHISHFSMAITRKTKFSSSNPVPKKQIIKVNPYENPENVMELMANICSAAPTADTDIFFDIISDAYNKEVSGKSLYDYLEEKRDNLLNKDFDNDLRRLCRELSWSLETRENTAHTQIVVAGGFSSGKSSFLNRLTNCTNLLPTGVEPVSVVKTYLYCSRQNNSISVKGVNQKNVLVNLDPGVLQAIQHAKKSNIYLASVLEKLFVEIPSTELDGLVFIDTPGYNNSDKANKSNGKTDKATALEAMKEGNVLFWLVDCERGTTVSNDIELMKQFEGKKVIIFNKADKKGYNESAKIVNDAAKTIYKEFPQEEIIDIIAFSTLDNKIYYSINNMTLEEIVKEAKTTGNGISEINEYKEKIAMLFDKEISASKDLITDIEDNYQECLDNKNELQEAYNNAKEDQKEIRDDLKKLLIGNYNEILRAAESLFESSKYAIDSYVEFFNSVCNFENNDHWGSSTILTNAIKKADKTTDRAIEKFNAVTDYQYYNEDYRKSVIERIDTEENIVVNRFKEWYEEASQNCQDKLNTIDNEKHFIKDIKKYRNIFLSAIDLGITQYQKQNKATTIQNTEYTIPNVFEAIYKDDYKLFLHSFENGVDLSICNPDGYNPLTLAVYTGNNSMVKFLLDHDADPSIKDKRGYNAFHTAVENQYRDICKMLLDLDPELIESKTSKGETVEDLAEKQSFSKWIQTEIDNAY